MYGLDGEIGCVDYRSMTLPQDIVKIQALVVLNSEFPTRLVRYLLESPEVARER